jgi:hypothetical protein
MAKISELHQSELLIKGKFLTMLRRFARVKGEEEKGKFSCKSEKRVERRKNAEQMKNLFHDSTFSFPFSHSAILRHCRKTKKVEVGDEGVREREKEEFFYSSLYF